MGKQKTEREIQREIRREKMMKDIEKYNEDNKEFFDAVKYIEDTAVDKVNTLLEDLKKETDIDLRDLECISKCPVTSYPSRHNIDLTKPLTKYNAIKYKEDASDSISVNLLKIILKSIPVHVVKDHCNEVENLNISEMSEKSLHREIYNHSKRGDLIIGSSERIGRRVDKMPSVSKNINGSLKIGTSRYYLLDDTLEDNILIIPRSKVGVKNLRVFLDILSNKKGVILDCRFKLEVGRRPILEFDDERSIKMIKLV